MKPKTIGNFISAVALLVISLVQEIQAQQCTSFELEGNESWCCTSVIIKNGVPVCDDSMYIGLKGMRGNLSINNDDISCNNNGTTEIYGETDIPTGGGLGDSNNIKAAKFGWKPITDTEFGRWGFNGYTNWTSPAVLIKSQYTGSNSEVIALKSISKYATGKGIGAQIEGNYKGVNIINNGGTSTKTTYGIFANSTASGTSVSTSIVRQGGYFSATGGVGGTRIGIYATATGGATATRYAGFFDYNVFVNGSVTAMVPLIIGSDRKLKENILDEKNILEKLLQLKPANYYFKKDVSATLNLPVNIQHGLIAQDVEEIFPELVSEITKPATTDPATQEEISKEISYKGVNYIGFIPLLIQSIKEQQEQITSLKSENEYLKTEISEINKKLNTLISPNVNSTFNDKARAPKSSYLEQNNPNPFNESTQINYSISGNARNALITIRSTNGTTLKTYSIEIVSNGNLIIPASTLAAGTYLYELIVDGLKVDSKKMTILK